MQAKLLLGLLSLAWSLGAQAELAPLPQPLSLSAALELADGVHPDLLRSAARRSSAEARLQQVQGDSDLRVSLIGELRYIEPPNGIGDQSSNDSLARLSVRQRLYDFGYSGAREAAAGQALEGADWDYRDARQQHRLAVMRAFFDVLLADPTYARVNEALAVVYVALDRARDRHELGQVSDVRLLELESEYQEVRTAFTRSRLRQRLTRVKLGQLLNRPDDPPVDLVMPGPVDVAAELAAEQQLQQQALAENPRLKALRARVQAAEQQLEAARMAYGPVLRGELGAGTYQRLLGSRNDWEAGLVLEVPLYTGRSADAETAAARAELDAARAELEGEELQVRHAVLENRLLLDDLKVRLEQVGVLGEYRELYLDRSRALYEMEVRTDLGDSMVQMSVVRLERAKAEFDWLMTQARLAALTGQLIEDEPQEEKLP
jgi:outer membrane protein TolC